MCSRARAPVQRQRPACGAGRVGAPGLSALGLSCHEGHRSAGWCLGGPSAHCWWPRGLFPVCDLVGRFLCRSALSLWGPKMLGRLLPGWAHLPSLSSRQPLSVGATCVSSLVAAWPLVLTPLLCLEGPRFLCGLAVEMQELDLPGGGGPAACPPAALLRTRPLLSRLVPPTPAAAPSVVSPCLQRSACPHRHPGYFLSQIFQFLCLQVQLGSSKHMFVKCPCKVSTISLVSRTGGAVIVTLTPLSSLSAPEPPWGLF